jgi:flagellar protein FlaJ
MNGEKLSVVMFGWLAKKYADFFVPVRDALPKADIKVPFLVYLSDAFFLAFVVYLIALFASLLVVRFLSLPLLISVASVVLFPVLVAAIFFVWTVFYPFQKVLIRKRNIEANLPFVIAHMSSIAEAGIPPYAMFKLVSAFKEYGEISKEMAKVARNIESFGMDPLRAVREVAERTPSEELREVLLGIITTVESGGDLKAYLKALGEQAMFEWRIRRERFLQQMSTYAEFYVGIIIAAPLFMVALFAVMSMIQPTIAGISIFDLTKLSIYVGIPAINIGFLAFLRTIEVEI